MSDSFGSSSWKFEDRESRVAGVKRSEPPGLQRLGADFVRSQPPSSPDFQLLSINRQQALTIALFVLASAVLHGGQSTVAAESSLRLRYTFAGVTGATVPDVSGTDHHGTLEGKEGHLPKVVDTPYGPALELLKDSGHGVRVKWADDLAGTDGLTVMAWVKPSEVRQHLAVVAGKSDSVKGRPASGYRLSIFWSRVLTDIGLGGETEQRLSSPEWSITADAWAHVAMTFDGSRMLVYINATVAAEHMFPEPAAITPFKRDLTIGKYFWNDAYPFTGLIADVRIYDRALQEPDIFSAARVFLHMRDDTGPAN